MQDCITSLLLPPATFISQPLCTSPIYSTSPHRDVLLLTPMHAVSTSPHRDVLLLTLMHAANLSQLCQLQPVGPKVARWSGFLIRTSRHRETGFMVSRYEKERPCTNRRFVLLSPIPSLAQTRPGSQCSDFCLVACMHL